MIREKNINLLLGTAMWGWTIPARQCHVLLDQFYSLGGRVVDCATNYPINKRGEDFRAAEKILAEWVRINEVNDLEIMMKIGSVNNLFTPEQNLSPSFLLLNADYYQAIFGSNLACIMIHWDNRDQKEEIERSLDVLLQLNESGLTIGLSGIKYPAVYQEVLKKYSFSSLPIQCKHNLVYSDLKRYAPLHDYGNFIAYGINGGGIKLDTERYGNQASLVARGGQPQQHNKLVTALNKCLADFGEKAAKRIVPASMNQLGMLYAAYHPLIKGILLGCSRPQQLLDSWQWADTLGKNDYKDLYLSLVSLAQQHPSAS
jgi:aryl-alcohol dehydrogenase-like predicted oxidoreductase